MDKIDVIFFSFSFEFAVRAMRLNNYHISA